MEDRLVIIELWSRSEGPSGIFHSRHANHLSLSKVLGHWVRPAFANFLQVRRLDREFAIFADLGSCQSDLLRTQRRLARDRSTSKLLGITYSAWKRIRQEVFIRDGHTCAYCGSKSNRLECDHVHPVSRGGLTILDNLVAACFSCNRSKGARLLSEWVR
ncbi:MAG: HNH endonuclease [Janthinobacterium lividum]